MLLGLLAAGRDLALRVDDRDLGRAPEAHVEAAPPLVQARP